MLVQALIARSMRLIRVLDPSEAPEAADYETAIVALNGMMTRLEANGTPLGWQNVTNPGDTLPIPPEAEEAIAFMLARIIGPEYGVAPDQTIMAAAVAGEQALVRDAIVASPILNNSTGPAPYRGRSGYCILDDSWGNRW